MITNQSTTVDLMRRNSPIEKIYCKQNDSKSRNIRLSISENGVPITDLTAPARVYYEDYKYRSLCYQDVQITNGTVEFTIVQTALSVSGEVRAELQILNADDEQEILSSATFIIDCDRQVNLSGRAGGDGKDVLETMVGKAVQGAVDNKVDKEEGKGLSSNDYTIADKELVQSIPNKAPLKIIELTNEQLFPLYLNGYNAIYWADNHNTCIGKPDGVTGFAMITTENATLLWNRKDMWILNGSIWVKINNVNDVKVDGISVVTDKVANISLSDKVDKIPGKGLSTNDYTNTDKELVQSIPNKANTSDVNDALANKVDKIPGKGLSTNDYTTAEKNKVAIIGDRRSLPSGYNDIISWILAEVFDAQTVGSIQAQIDKNRADHNNMEMKENKVTAMSEESTDEQYPSAKAVWDLVVSISNKIDKIIEKIGGIDDD